MKIIGKVQPGVDLPRADDDESLTSATPGQGQVRGGFIPPYLAGQPKKEIGDLAYWPARGLASIESALYGTAQAPLALVNWLGSGSTDPAYRETIGPGVDRALQVLDPNNPETVGGVPKLTPSVNKTREYRDLEAYNKGAMRGHLNRIGEAAFDVGSVIGQIVALGKVPFFGATMGPTSGLTKMQKAIVAGEAVKDAAFKTAVTRSIIKNAAVMGVHGAITTSGDAESRAKTAVGRMLGGLSGLGVQASGATGFLSQRAVDFVAQTLLSSPYYKEYYDNAGGFNDEFWGQALPQLTVDVAMSLYTGGVPTQKSVKQAVKRHDAKQYTQRVAKGEIDPKTTSLQDYEALQGELRATLAKVFATKDVTMPADVEPTVVDTGITLPGKERIAKIGPATEKGTGAVESMLVDTEPLAPVKKKEVLDKATAAVKTVTIGGQPYAIKDLPAPVQARLAEELNARMAAGEAEPDFKSLLDDFFQRNNNTVFWLGGDPLKDDIDIWFRNKTMKARDVADLAAKEGLSLQDLTVVSRLSEDAIRSLDAKKRDFSKEILERIYSDQGEFAQRLPRMKEMVEGPKTFEQGEALLLKKAGVTDEVILRITEMHQLGDKRATALLDKLRKMGQDLVKAPTLADKLAEEVSALVKAGKFLKQPRTDIIALRNADKAGRDLYKVGKKEGKTKGYIYFTVDRKTGEVASARKSGVGEYTAILEMPLQKAKDFLDYKGYAVPLTPMREEVDVVVKTPISESVKEGVEAKTAEPQPALAIKPEVLMRYAEGKYWVGDKSFAKAQQALEYRESFIKRNTDPVLPLPERQEGLGKYDTTILNATRRATEALNSKITTQELLPEQKLVVETQDGGKDKVTSGYAGSIRQPDGSGTIVIKKDAATKAWQNWALGGSLFPKGLMIKTEEGHKARQVATGELKGIYWPIEPRDLPLEDFLTFIEEHEKVHLLTGRDGTAIDENVVNIVAFERMGRADLAERIESGLGVTGTSEPTKISSENRELKLKISIDQEKSVKAAGQRIDLALETKNEIQKAEARYEEVDLNKKAETENTLLTFAQQYPEAALKLRNAQQTVAGLTEGDLVPGVTEIKTQMDAIKILDGRGGSGDDPAAASSLHLRTREELEQEGSTIGAWVADMRYGKDNDNKKMKSRNVKDPVTGKIQRVAAIREPKQSKLDKTSMIARIARIQDPTLFLMAKNNEINYARSLLADLPEEVRVHWAAEISRIDQAIKEAREKYFKDTGSVKKVKVEKEILVSAKPAEEVVSAKPAEEVVSSFKPAARSDRAALADLNKPKTVSSNIPFDISGVTKTFTNRISELVRDLRFAQEDGRTEDVKIAREMIREVEEGLVEGVTDSEQKKALREMFNRVIEERMTVKISDLFGGTEAEFLDREPSLPKTSPSLGSDGKRLQDVGHSLSIWMRMKKFFGAANDAANGFAGYFAEKTAVKDRLGRPVSRVEIGQKVHEIVIKHLNKADQLNDWYGKCVQDAVLHKVNEYVLKTYPGADTVTRQKYLNLWLDYMSHMDEEVHVNEGDSFGKYVRTEKGAGEAWRTPAQAKLNLKAFDDFAALLNIPVDPVWRKAAEQQRPAEMFWQFAPKELKLLVLWGKDQVYNPILKTMMASGLLDNADMISNISRGYHHNHAYRPEVQKQAGGTGVGKGVPNIRELAKEHDTVAEFNDAWKDTDGATKDYAKDLAHYVGSNLKKIDLNRGIQLLKRLPAPIDDRDMKLVEYEADWKKQAEAEGISAKTYLEKRGYKQAHNMPGLTERIGKSAYYPWVHHSIESIIVQSREMGKGFDPEKEPGINAINKINQFVKRAVIPFPMMFALDSVNTAVHLPGGAGAVWKNTLKPILTGQLYWGGLPYAKKMWKGELSPFEHVQGMGYDPKKLDLFLSYGMPSFSTEWVYKSLYDVEARDEGKHPLQKSSVENIKDTLMGKGGLDYYAFNRYIAKNVYQLTDCFYEKLRSQGRSEEDAARLSAHFVGDITRMIDRNIYGAEGKWMQLGLFARDFTIGFAREVTGATYPLWKSQHKYRTEGLSKTLNSIFHGETSRADMEVLAPLYAQHFAKVAVARLAFVNLISFGLSFFNEDEKEQGKFAFENEPGKKLQIKLPTKDQYGNPVYLDVLAFRELSEVADLTFFQGRPAPVSAAMKFVRGKLSYLFGQVIDQFSNTDYAGQPIALKGSASEPLDRAGYAVKGMLPTVLRTDQRRPLGAGFTAGQVAGFPVKSGRYLEPGYSYEQSGQMQEIIRQEQFSDQERQRKKYLATMPELMGMLQRGEITPEEYRNEYLKRRYPQSAMLKGNKKDMYRGGYWGEGGAGR